MMSSLTHPSPLSFWPSPTHPSLLFFLAFPHPPLPAFFSALPCRRFSEDFRRFSEEALHQSEARKIFGKLGLK